MTKWHQARRPISPSAGLILVLVSLFSFNPNFALASEAKAKSVTRTIYFPKNYSLGTAYVIPFKAEKLNLWPNEAISKQKAQGNFEVRGTGLVLLVGSYDLAQNTSVLKTLKPNDIQVLDVYRCEIEDKDIENITSLSGLYGLTLDDTEITDKSLKTIAKLPNLMFVTMASTQMTGATISCLAPLKKLRRVEFGHNILNKQCLTELAKVPQIERLGLQGCKINDSDLEKIGKLTNLTVLMLTENSQITDIGMKHLAALKRLTILAVPHAQITTNGLKALTKLPLSQIVLSKKQFTPSQIQYIKKLFPKTEIAIYDTSDRMDPELFKPLH